MDGSRGKGKKLSGKAESCMVSLIGGIQKIIQMSLYSKQTIFRSRLTDIENKFMVPKGERGDIN